MNHREAIGCLAEYATRSLTEAFPPDLEIHLRGCPTCQRWLDTYLLLCDLSSSLAGTSSDDNGHADPQVLALCATRPDELEPPEQDDLVSHLADCATCRKELDLVREAVLEARSGVEGGELPPPIRLRPAALTSSLRLPWMVAAAASLVAFVVPAAILVLGSSRVADESASVRQQAGGAVETVEGLQIDGFRTIAGERTLLVSHVKVGPGAQVRFQAGKGVRFGEGFRISDGASIAVQVTGDISGRGL